MVCLWVRHDFLYYTAAEAKELDTQFVQNSAITPPSKYIHKEILSKQTLQLLMVQKLQIHTKITQPLPHACGVHTHILLQPDHTCHIDAACIKSVSICTVDVRKYIIVTILYPTLPESTLFSLLSKGEINHRWHDKLVDGGSNDKKHIDADRTYPSRTVERKDAGKDGEVHQLY